VLRIAFSVVCLIIHGNSWNRHDPHLLVPAARERERSHRPSASFMLRERKRGVCERGREGGRKRAGESERESERAKENDHMGLQPLPEREVERKKERESDHYFFLSLSLFLSIPLSIPVSIPSRIK